MRSRAVWICTAVVCACAQPLPPPGGTPDREAPRLVSTKPEQRALLSEWEGPVVFTFDEQLSERGARDAVMVSPETGRPVLERDGAELKVRLEGGWKRNTVYRVIITPGIQDRFSNARREPTELVFSTGPPLLPTALGGLVTDRITGRPLADIQVVAIPFPDSSVWHATVTDTAGFFGLRYLPLGRYTVRAFEDRNRNKKVDRSEKQAERSLVIGFVSDSQVVQFALIAPDTSPARLTRADARDSLEVRLTFDDFLDPERPLTGATVSLFQLPDSVALAGARLVHVRAFDQARRAQPGDSTGARARPPVPAAAGVPGAQQDTVTRPTQELVLVPGAPLQPGTRYLVEVGGITNLLVVPNGGGRARFQTQARVQRDTTGVRRDTIPVRRDTVQLMASHNTGSFWTYAPWSPSTMQRWHVH